jgi:hypothetical protein
LIGDAPEGYELSKREELGPLVRDFHELMNRDLSNGELLALDFALEWTIATLEGTFEEKLSPEFGVTYGMLPNIKLMEVSDLVTAKKVARALNGQIRVRYTTKWELWKE